MGFVEEVFGEALGAVGVEGELLCAERVPQRHETGFSLRDRNAGLQASDECEPDEPVVVEAVATNRRRHGDFGHADGKEKTWLVAADGGLEGLGRYADDSERMTVDAHSLADDGG